MHNCKQEQLFLLIDLYIDSSADITVGCNEQADDCITANTAACLSSKAAVLAVQQNKCHTGEAFSTPLSIIHHQSQTQAKPDLPNEHSSILDLEIASEEPSSSSTEHHVYCFGCLILSLFLLFSKIKAWRQKRALSSVKKAQKAEEPKRWEQDYELIPCEGLFDEYLEIGKMIIFHFLMRFLLQVSIKNVQLLTLEHHGPHFLRGTSGSPGSLGVLDKIRHDK